MDAYVEHIHRKHDAIPTPFGYMIECVCQSTISNVSVGKKGYGCK